jgi:4-carboxymuconolactone decarboxylase
MRLSRIEVEDLAPDQRAVLDAIQSGPRKSKHGSIGMVGPFGVWVRAPKVGLATQALGAAARFGSSLPENVSEVAICTVGAFYRAKFEFAAHKNLALAAGVDAEQIERLRVAELPTFAGAEDLAYRVATSLMNQHRIDSNTYAGALAQFGEDGLIELVTVIGYYCMVSLTLNAFEIPLTSDMEDPFPDD